MLLRVSTHSQGADGHGVAAQRRDIQLFLNTLQEKPEVVAEFVEVESGAKETRPVLEDALRICREQKASLLVQKVDRITRDLEVLARIVKDPEVTLRVASLPNADNFQIHLFGCLAAQEREFISTRTKAALAAAKAKGVVLGNPQLAEMNRTRRRLARKFADQHSNSSGLYGIREELSVKSVKSSRCRNIHCWWFSVPSGSGFPGFFVGHPIQWRQWDEVKVTLYVSGTVFQEVVQARDYDSAVKTAIARNPTATVVSVTAVF